MTIHRITRADFSQHVNPGVGDRNHNVLPCTDLCVFGSIGIIEIAFAVSIVNLPPGRHGVARIDCKVEKSALDL